MLSLCPFRPIRARRSSRVLRPHGGAKVVQQREAVSSLILSVLDRYPVPATISRQDWSAARDTLALRLGQIGLHAPKLAKDIPEPFARAYFELMPIHEKLRGRDFSTIHNYLKATLCNIHEELTQRMDAPAVAVALAAATELHGAVGSTAAGTLKKRQERE